MKKGSFVPMAVMVLGWAFFSYGLDFTVQRVTDNTVPNNIPWHQPIQVDALGNAHIGYVEEVSAGNDEICYATNASGSWVTTRVTDNGVNDNLGLFILDDDGHAHFVYVRNDGTDNEIYYSTNASGSFIEAPVTNNDDNDAFWWAVLDKDGYFHVAYSRAVPNEDIYYANNKTGHFLEERVSRSLLEDWLWQFSLIVDGDGFAHIVYEGQDPNEPANDWEVFYINNTSGTFPTEPVYVTDNSVDDRLPTSVKFFILDDAGKVHVVYYNVKPGPQNDIWYAENTAGPFVRTPVTTSTNNNGWWPSWPFLLDDAGHAHVVYLEDDGDFEIYYANDATGSFVPSRITENTTPDLCLYRFFNLDADDKAHLIYMGVDSDGDAEIYYAQNTAGPFLTQKVTDNLVNDWFACFYLDGGKKTHLVYVEEPAPNAIIYATNQTGIFVPSEITDHGQHDHDVYWAIDGAGYAHLAFLRDDPDAEVFYAHSNEPLGVAEPVARVSQPISLTVVPSVFARSSTIHYQLEGSGEVELRVYDVSGQKVRTLVSGVRSAGTHSLVWDGRSDAQVLLPTGVYFLRLETEKESQTQKLTIIR